MWKSYPYVRRREALVCVVIVVTVCRNAASFVPSTSAFLNLFWSSKMAYVRTVGTSAFVTTVGVGLQQIDLNEVAKRGEFRVVSLNSSYPIALPDDGKGSNKYDISTNLAGID